MHVTVSAIAKENSEQKNKSLFSLALRCYQSSLFDLFSFVDTFKKLLTLHKTKQKKTGVAKCFFSTIYRDYFSEYMTKRPNLELR